VSGSLQACRASPGFSQADLARELRGFLTEAGSSVRRVYSGPVSYSALPFERVNWDHFDVVGVNYYRQQAPATDQYLAKISRLQATGKPVAVTEFGFPACRDADDPNSSAPSTRHRCPCWECRYRS
jgi:hypothetical protein